MKREKYTTSLKPNLIPTIKIQAIHEDRPVNEMLEDIIEKYLEEKGWKKTDEKWEK